VVELAYAADLLTKPEFVLPGDDQARRHGRGAGARRRRGGRLRLRLPHHRRYLETTDDAYVQADSTIVSRRCLAISRKCWLTTTSR